MKRLGALTCVAVMLFAALVLTVPLAAQEQPQTHYTVEDLGTLGGTFSWAYGINNKGSVTGFAYLPGDTESHAFLWQKGVMTDLGTLGGPNSTPVYRHNERDEVVGLAETSTPDPWGGELCGDGLNFACVPFLWRNGEMTPLLTLGGNNGQASSVNNRGQIVGGVQNSTPAACFGFQYKPVIWENGQIEELPTLPDDAIGFAQWINDRGQAVGTSADECFAVRNAVLWEKGMVTYLGSLGGTFNAGLGINNRGQVSGVSSLPDDATFHAFLWQKNMGMKDLGTLIGDLSSIAYGINNQGQVVGGSCDVNFNCRAFLWQDGVMTDLNTLIPGHSPWFLADANGINSRAEIVGLAFNMTTGEGHAFLLTPRTCEPGSQCDTLAAPSDNRARPRVVLPESVRKLLQQRQGNRLGVGLKRPQ